MEDVDTQLSAVLDTPGELLPLLTFGEARAILYVTHLLGLGDGEASSAARDLEARLSRRLEACSPDVDILINGVRYDW